MGKQPGRTQEPGAFTTQQLRLQGFDKNRLVVKLPLCVYLLAAFRVPDRFPTVTSMWTSEGKGFFRRRNLRSSVLRRWPVQV